MASFKYLLPFIFIFSKSYALDVYSFEDCINQVLTNNAELEMARSSVRASHFDVKASRSSFVPKLSAGITKNVDKTTILESDPTLVGTDLSGTNSSLAASLNASLNLFSGFRDIGTYEQTSFIKESTEQSYQQTKATLSAELKIAFENLIYAKESKKLSEQIIKRREENLKLVELRFQGGLENKGSVLLSRANYAQAEYDDLQSENAITTAKARLAKVLGFDSYHKFDIKGEIPKISKVEDKKLDFYEIAVLTPNYKRVEARVKASEKAISISKSNFYPSLELTGSLRRTGDDFFPSDRESASFGVVLSIPLFDGGKDYYGHKSSVEAWTSVESERISLRRDLVLKLEQSYSGLKEAYSKFNVDKSFRDAVTVRADIARNKYNNGLLTFENWDIIENDLISRQKAFLISKREVTNAEAGWEEIRGISLIP